MLELSPVHFGVAARREGGLEQHNSGPSEHSALVWLWITGEFIKMHHLSHVSKAMASHSSALAWKSHGRGACWAAVHGVAKSRTWLKWLSSSSSRDFIKWGSHVCIYYVGTYVIDTGLNAGRWGQEAEKEYIRVSKMSKVNHFKFIFLIPMGKWFSTIPILMKLWVRFGGMETDVAYRQGEEGGVKSSFTPVTFLAIP